MGNTRPHRRATLALAALGCLTACAEPPPPNVLLVVVDTLRADHCSVYGYERDTTPRLSAFAEQGARFERAYAPVGLTAPTHASLFTALHPMTHGLVSNGLALGDEHVTLAEYLSVRGYQTAAIVSSFVLDQRFGLDQGFAFYDDAFDRDEATVSQAEWEGFDVEDGFDRRADHTTRRAVRWLRERRNEAAPFLLFVHYFDPHSPYEPAPSHANHFAPTGDDPLAHEVAAYDSEIAFTDAAIGGLLDALDELGLAGRTIAVVTADHGEGLMQRGYMLHGVSVHEEEVRVPLLVRWPGRIPAGQRIAEPVSVLDLVPTLADLVAVTSMGGAYEGRSLAAALTEAAPLDPERALVLYRRDFGPGPTLLDDGDATTPDVEVAGAQFALREGRWKYVLAPREAPPALYDLEADPAELVNLAPEGVPQTRRLRSRLERWLAAHPTVEATPREPTAEDRARLRALGYGE